MMQQRPSETANTGEGNSGDMEETVNQDSQVSTTKDVHDGANGRQDRVHDKPKTRTVMMRESDEDKARSDAGNNVITSNARLNMQLVKRLAAQNVENAREFARMSRRVELKFLEIAGMRHNVSMNNRMIHQLLEYAVRYGQEINHMLQNNNGNGLGVFRIVIVNVQHSQEILQMRRKNYRHGQEIDPVAQKINGMKQAVRQISTSINGNSREIDLLGTRLQMSMQVSNQMIENVRRNIQHSSHLLQSIRGNLQDINERFEIIQTNIRETRQMIENTREMQRNSVPFTSINVITIQSTDIRLL